MTEEVHLATSELGFMASAPRPEDGRFVIASADGRVGVWEVEPVRAIATFDSRFAGVLGRIAVATTGGDLIVVAAELHDGVVAAYDGATGKQRWVLNLPRPVQQLCHARRSSDIAIVPDRGPLVIVDAENGVSLGSIPRVRGLYPNPNAPIAVAEYESHAALVRTDPWAVIGRLLEPAAVLAVSFAPEAVMLSLSEDPDERASFVQTYDLGGQLLWRDELPRGLNVPWLSYDLQLGEWVGVWHDPEQLEPDRVIRWHRDGERAELFDLGIAQDYAFVRGAEYLASPGRVRQARTGTVVGALQG